MDKNMREGNINFFHHVYPFVRKLQKHVYINLPHAPSKRVNMDMAEDESERPIFTKARYGVVW